MVDATAPAFAGDVERHLTDNTLRETQGGTHRWQPTSRRLQGSDRVASLRLRSPLPLNRSLKKFETMKGSLHHKTPGWVPVGMPFHVRIGTDRKAPGSLTEAILATHIMDAALRYHADERWSLKLMVVMPDHIHMVACFPGAPGMSATVGAWKAYLAKRHGVRWQGNYFDHRLRNDDEYLEKAHYIRMNPVRAGLCASIEDWKWIVDGECLG